MTRRPLAALLLAAAVLAAGCVGGFGSGTPDATTAETTDGTTTHATTTGVGPADAALPPGVTESGLANATKLVAAHEAALAETGYEFRFTASTWYGNETSAGTQTGTVAVGLSSFLVTKSVQDDSSTYTTATWANESVALTAFTSDGERRYQERERNADTQKEITSQATKAITLQSILDSGEFSVTEVERTGERTLTTVRADAYAGDARFDDVSEYNATVVVDASGRVHEFHWTVETADLRRESDFELTAIGPVSVERPDWAGAAAETVNADVDVTSDEEFVVVHHRGGDALPAGSTVEIGHDGETHAFELESPLVTQGDRYIYYPADGGDPVMTDDRPTDVDAERVDGSYSVTVTDPQGRTVHSTGFGVGHGEASQPTTTASGSADE
ncbi:DUF7537 family lipoprotein [Halomicrococcus gelatinilyticus]|uniref:DUF7537 family lipoprotein n=1 Tax=Halomicrococcus gelatinilyticus TaxID=1702103 RepID=UPI002E14BDB9